MQTAVKTLGSNKLTEKVEGLVKSVIKSAATIRI